MVDFWNTYVIYSIDIRQSLIIFESAHTPYASKYTRIVAMLRLIADKDHVMESKLIMMFDLNRFVNEEVTMRRESMFLPDILTHKEQLKKEILGKRVLVIGGAGSIGSSFIKAILRFNPKQLVVIDLNENGLAELTRDLRSSVDFDVPNEYLTYTLDFDSKIFQRIFRENNGFDIVANFSAHKHVRSEKDRNSVEALLENNVIKAHRLLDLLSEIPPRHFFCVSTDKAANPVNVMGASKRLMEDLIMAYSSRFKVTTARFANVAFSNGSLPASFLDRMMKRQPIVAPSDVKRFFVSPEESGQICLLACVLGKSGEVYFPKLKETQMMRFSTIADRFLYRMGYEPQHFSTDEEARQAAAVMEEDCRQWPVVYFKSDTTGEKDYEEFYVPGEEIDLDSYTSLGVIKNSHKRDLADVDAFLNRLKAIFETDNFTKLEIVEALKEFIPNFEHEEKGRNLDQKM